MIRIKDQIFYSCTEIAKNIEHRDPGFVDLHHKFCDVYHKGYEDYIYSSYIQNKLYKAAEKKLIRYALVKKNTMTVRVFSIEDIMTFLDLPEAAGVERKPVKDENITIMEVGA